MNAWRPKKMKAGRLAVGVALMGLTGCAGALAAETDAQSPLAPEIGRTVAAHRAYPRWADFPTASTDAPTPAQVALAVNTLKISGAAANGEASRIDWRLSDPEGFAATVAQRVGAVPVSPAAARTQEEIEALAERLRERAVAPPPIPRAPLPRP